MSTALDLYRMMKIIGSFLRTLPCCTLLYISVLSQSVTTGLYKLQCNACTVKKLTDLIRVFQKLYPKITLIFRPVIAYDRRLSWVHLRPVQFSGILTFDWPAVRYLTSKNLEENLGDRWGTNLKSIASDASLCRLQKVAYRKPSLLINKDKRTLPYSRITIKFTCLVSTTKIVLLKCIKIAAIYTERS